MTNESQVSESHVERGGASCFAHLYPPPFRRTRHFANFPGDEVPLLAPLCLLLPLGGHIRTLS